MAEDEIAEANSLLEQVVYLAQPGGFIRLFVDLGPRMAQALERLASTRNDHTEYVDRILNAFTEQQVTPEVIASQYQDTSPTPYLLTERETDVLTLLAQRRSDKEIATTLVISLNTVSTHTRNLFSKLDVHNRREAVARARELGLLPSE
jgi:LuxR family maltose regulon positive regulatory protein